MSLKRSFKGLQSRFFKCFSPLLSLSAHLRTNMHTTLHRAVWPLYVDERVMQLEWVVLGGGGRDTKIKILSSVFSQLGAQIVPDLAIERTAPA